VGQLAVTGKLVDHVRGAYPLADDDPRWQHDPKAIVESVLRAGVTVVQLRLKRTIDREALELARWAATRARSANALLVVNDRYDLADLAGAGGVHLGDEDLPPERIPSDIRSRLVIGLSTHTLDQVRASRDRPVDYIAFGPVFGTASKETKHTPRGTEALAQAVNLAGRPVVAIGGITLENVSEVRQAGACAFAFISAVADARQPEKAVRQLNARFTGENN
jgi:thiamine-phosphate pyrophosphorylase